MIILFMFFIFAYIVWIFVVAELVDELFPPKFTLKELVGSTRELIEEVLDCGS